MTNASIDPKLVGQWHQEALVNRLQPLDYIANKAAAHWAAQAQPVTTPAPTNVLLSVIKERKKLEHALELACGYLTDEQAAEVSAAMPPTQPRAVELPEPDKRVQSLIDDLYENGDPTSVDAAEILQTFIASRVRAVEWPEPDHVVHVTDSETIDCYTADQVHQLLAAERQKLQDVLMLAREALLPFADDANGIHPDWSSERRRSSLTQDKPLLVGDFRAAAAAIAAIDKHRAESLAKEATPLLDKDGNKVGLHWDRALSGQEVKAVSDFAIRESKGQS